MPGKTLEELYHDQKDNKIKLLYNDEPPSGKSDETRGHTKGVVVANDISGFWMIHSVPKFPPEIEKGVYGFPEGGEVYGQSFLCISMTGDEIWKVGKQLQFNEPHFYSSHVPTQLRS
jgi:deoxyribonuclease II